MRDDFNGGVEGAPRPFQEGDLPYLTFIGIGPILPYPIKGEFPLRILLSG